MSQSPKASALDCETSILFYHMFFKVIFIQRLLFIRFTEKNMKFPEQVTAGFKRVGENRSMERD